MPLSTSRRFTVWGRPPFGPDLQGGNSGAIRAHWASVRSESVFGNLDDGASTERFIVAPSWRVAWADPSMETAAHLGPGRGRPASRPPWDGELRLESSLHY